MMDEGFKKLGFHDEAPRNSDPPHNSDRDPPRSSGQSHNMNSDQ